MSVKLSYRFLVIVFIIFIIAIGGSQCQIVQTNSGPVKGVKEELKFGSIFMFKNIPYAKPPVDDLRFKLPEEIENWTELDQERNAPCPQIPYYTTKADSLKYTDEDCLLLDIYTVKDPDRPDPALSLPVLVYFHGGKFLYGSKDEYKPIPLMQEKDMVVAVVNYRLGALGFLSTQNSDVPGNAGLFDQRMALKWIVENIEFFGGDKLRITIGGHGAGGVSVGMHMLSLKSQDYFSAAISGSGTALDPWAMSRDAWSNAVLLAKNLSCPVSSSNALVECLRKTPVEEILTAQKLLQNITFRPVVDGSSPEPFLEDTPSSLYEKSKQKAVPYLAGVTKNEASIEFFSKFPEAVKTANLDRIISYLLDPYLAATSNPDSVVKAAKYQYLRGVDIPTFVSVAPEMIDLMSDFLYKSSLEQTLKFHSINSPQTYMYVFEFAGEQSLGDVYGLQEYRGKYGVCHMEDVIYLFHTTFGSWVWNSTSSSLRSTAFIERWTKAWRNFIISRQPPQELRWLQFNSKEAMNYLQVSDNFANQKNYREIEMDFWSILVPDLQSVRNSSVDDQVTGKIGDSSSAATWGVAGIAILLAVLCVALVGVVMVTRKKFTRRISQPVSSASEMSEAKQSKV